MRSTRLLFIALFLISGCSATPTESDIVRHRVAIGDDFVNVVDFHGGEPGLTFINIHENEETSIEAAREHVRLNGGRLIYLEHSGERNITFSVADTTYRVDPNRIYTDTGIRKTLENLSTYSDSAARAVRSFRDMLLDIFDVDSLPVVVAVHNNTDGQYSILSYRGDGSYASDAALTHVEPDQDIDDFYFVTEADWFEPISRAGYNIAVQDSAAVTDDGSLSVYCGQQGIPYVNVEAEHGHLDMQLEMLDFLDAFLHADVLADGG